VIALLLLAAIPPQPVLRFAVGPVAVTSTGANTIVETGADGYAEVHLHRIGRLRLSAATRAVIGEGGVRLLSGRIWAQIGASQLAISTIRHRADLGPRTSAIIERTTGGGTSFAVRAGRASLSDREGARQELEEGQTVRVVPGISGIPAPMIGGRGIGELVTLEARRAMNDPLGIQSFLLERSLESQLARRAARGVRQQVRSSSEVTGAEGMGLVEDAFRPPPFFEAEVPPKGPNVRVEVEFEPWAPRTPPARRL
jgi:hypothetical protein